MHVGLVIGHNGSTIKEITQRSHARIDVRREFFNRPVHPLRMGNNMVLCQVCWLSLHSTSLSNLFISFVTWHCTGCTALGFRWSSFLVTKTSACLPFARCTDCCWSTSRPTRTRTLSASRTRLQCSWDYILQYNFLSCHCALTCGWQCGREWLVVVASRGGPSLRPSDRHRRKAL